MAAGPSSLVSVIVPAWNAEKTLLETLQSAAAQTHRNLEILIVDDGSTDRTAEIAADFCASEPRARLVRKTNGGLASARNRGIDEAQGDWIAPLDADDLWHPEKIERQLQTFANSPPGAGLVYSWYRVIDEQGMVVEPPWAPVFEGSVFREHLACNFGTGSSALIRRSALGELRYSTELSRVDDGGCEDWLLQLQLAAESEVRCTRAFLVGYRARPGSMSSDKERMIRAHLQMYRIIQREFPGRESRVLRQQMARWRAAHAVTSLRRGFGPRALLEFAGAFASAPLSLGETAIRRLFAPPRRGTSASPSCSFHSLSADNP